MQNNILDNISSPKDLKELTVPQLRQLAQEVRQQLIETVSHHGGHIGPNLGVVELTIALLRVFAPPHDKIIWDVGHQTYVYKMLTGRLDSFKKSLRQDDGCCGFPHRDESPYDSFGTGHAGTAISAALGMAVARDMLSKHEKLIAVVGDGALGCGISLEALNHIAEVTSDFVLVVNDNEMSIGNNVGAIAKHLDRIIASSASVTLRRGSRKSRSFSFKNFINNCRRKLLSLCGKKQAETESFFEHLGVRYIGPVNGHDTKELLSVFNSITQKTGPVVVHVITEKGRGYEPAKNNPELFHGLGCFNAENGTPHPSTKPAPSFSSVFGDEMCKLAENRSNVVAVTAGMCLGTGLDKFRQNFPSRLFDVGIAEEHAVIYAAGMAVNGVHPLVALYGTFAQRAFDCVYHDVCLQNLPVVFTMDRSGIVPDGPTHHGIYDLSFWQAIPNLSIMQPASAWELQQMLPAAFDHKAPVVIRYPKSNCAPIPSDNQEIEWGKASIVRDLGDRAYIWAVGAEVTTALEVQNMLANKGIQTIVVNTRFLRPFDEELFLRHIKSAPVFTIEDHVAAGGLASISDSLIASLENHFPCKHFCWTQQVIPWGTVNGIRKKFDMTAEQIADQITIYLNSNQE